MAPSISFGERPASWMARRAASAATIRSEWSCWGPATTPRPTIAYCPEDACLGTVLVLPFKSFVSAAFCIRSSPLRRDCDDPTIILCGAGAPCIGPRRDQAPPCAGACRQPEHAPIDLDAGERIVEQAIELAELAGIVDARQGA